MITLRMWLFWCWLGLCVQVSLSVMKDCSNVRCPSPQDCIETMVEQDSCCPVCARKGCACEGYQYYDCVHAGFENGRVPEGQSYYVDFGSTKCTCPIGGGSINCQFIPCPELPANCIDIRQPMDGCQQCGQIGCVQGNRKYEAGHSHVDQCKVCHCPSEGGKLMCSPIPGCDPHDLVTIPYFTRYAELHDSQEKSAEPVSEEAPKTKRLPKEDQPKHGVKGSGPTPAVTTTSSTTQAVTEPLSTTVPPASSEATLAPSTTLEVTESPDTSEPVSEVEVVPTQPPATAAPNKTSPAQTTQTTAKGVPREDADGNVKDAGAQAKGGRNVVQRKQHPTSPPGEVTVSEAVTEKPETTVKVETETTTAATSGAPVTTEVGETSQTSPGVQHQTATTASVEELVETCCDAGAKWASANGHCRGMEAPDGDRRSICWTTRQQCCAGFLREQVCLAGMRAAREGNACQEDAGDQCAVSSYKECCDCCSLGLKLRGVGHRCEARSHLDFHCRRALLACCHGDEGRPGRHLIRERPALDSTSPPKKVSDSSYFNQAFSISEENRGENAAEGPVGVEDMDECSIYEGGICHQRCVNTPGSFRCECFPGFTLQEDAYTCVQEKAAEENARPDSPPETAAPNPCEGSGPCEQRCTAEDGRPRCSCFPGFSLAADGRSCEDVNECLSADACPPHERCANTAGSFVCRRPASCPPGYQGHGDICEDVNECERGVHGCGPDSTCVNTEGSFRCESRPPCPTGFQQDPHGNCVDVDECQGPSPPCGPGFSCVNTVGSHACHRKMMCGRGYHASPDGDRCIDVDECQSSLHQCGEGQLCHNLAGSYRCECQTGYQLDSFRKMCVDINECWRFPGRLCAQSCENTPGSFHCSCTQGFRLAGDGNNCEDVNECLASPCSQECANIYGSYQCYCRQGYYLREDGHTCEDIDECTQSIGHLCTYKCVNVPGSYRCACPEHGYAMSSNGRSCRDIDECTTGTHNCSLTETCYNIQGGHRCLSLSCPANYRKVSDTRCERINCPSYMDCQNSPLRITYYYLSFQSNIVIPAQIFRIGPSPAYSGDNVVVSITEGNEENFFSTRKLNSHTGAVFLHRHVDGPRDFLITVEMKLWRQGTFTTFQARIYVFITANSL